MTLCKLYKKDTKGKIREWQVVVRDTVGLSTIGVKHGLKDGQQVEKYTEICDGKNLGKANETTVPEQARLEAESKWNKQKDKGYFESEAKAKTEQIIRPMLAHRYDKHPAKILFPCYIQPKLDGVRCLIYADGRMESRKGKEFLSMPHIAKAVKDLKLPEGHILDGELYVHGEEFQDLISAIKRDKPSEKSALVEYHIYDVVTDKPFNMRNKYVKNLLGGSCKCLKYVETNETSKKDVVTFHKLFLKQGYEGSILRNMSGNYEIDKRSYNLQKMKDFDDAEFKIVGGKLDKDGGCVFECITDDGNEFSVRPEGDVETREQYYDDIDDLIGKLLTVRYFGMTTSDNPVPRFPVGVEIRDFE